MYRIVYPEDKNSFQDKYLAMFSSSLSKMQSEWAKIINSLFNMGAKNSIYPQNVSEILIMPYEGLCDIYKDFFSLAINKNSLLFTQCKQLFNYNGINIKEGAVISQMQAKISDFFMEYSEILNIHTCYYCNLSYINVYKISAKNKNHFDIDHFLPKSECPLLALSLYNFVPSCQVCNEKLKKEKLIGNLKNIHLTSPTGKDYDFDKAVKIDVDVKDPFSLENKCSQLYFSKNEPYSKEIEILKLEERYNYHKCEADRLLSLMQRYPKSNIKMLSKTLKIPEENIIEDIFGIDYLKENNRCLKKINIDIFEKYYK